MTYKVDLCHLRSKLCSLNVPDSDLVNLICPLRWRHKGSIRAQRSRDVSWCSQSVLTEFVNTDDGRTHLVWLPRATSWPLPL